jgi:hypothetical protein
LVTLQTKKKKLSYKVFWSLYIGFVVILEVAQGCYCNYHILNIILKKLVSIYGWPRVIQTARVRLSSHQFGGGVWKISTPFTPWYDALFKIHDSLLLTSISLFPFSSLSPPRVLRQPLQNLFCFRSFF